MPAKDPVVTAVYKASLAKYYYSPITEKMRKIAIDNVRKRLASATIELLDRFGKQSLAQWIADWAMIELMSLDAERHYAVTSLEPPIRSAKD